jgi:serine/threonine-protein kinase
MTPATERRPERQVDRYAIFDEIAAGGMATVHLGRLLGSAGFSRVIAAKRMHRHFLRDPDFKRMFLAEARLAARIRHPNVVPIVDVLAYEDELIIVMEYVHGDSLLALLRAARKSRKCIPIPIGCAIVVGMLEGLHAAHEAQNERGEPLGIVHRDVSPQNVLVGTDGVARVLDFGIAKAVHEQHQTNPGTLKGKYSYMAPEVVTGATITRQADVFSAGVVLWEVLAGKMLFGGATEHQSLLRIVHGGYPSPRQHNPAVPPSLEAVVARALEMDTAARYATALEFAVDLERVLPLAPRRVVGAWVQQWAAATLEKRESLIHDIETSAAVPQSHLTEFASARTPAPVSPEEMGDSVPLQPAAACLASELEPAPLPAAGWEEQSVASAEDQSDSYASIALDGQQGSQAAPSAGERRTLLRRAAIAIAMLGVAALVAVLLIPRKTPAMPPRSVAVSSERVHAPLPPPRPVVMPMPSPPAEPAPAAPAATIEPEAPSPAEVVATETATKHAKPHSPSRPSNPTHRPARATHARQYLPNKL